MTVAQMLEETATDGFMVLHRGRVVMERYFNDMARDSRHLLMSVSKSITSTVAGILAGRGELDVNALVTALIPELRGTSFEGATVQHLLDMRTGTRFNEEYADLNSDVRVYEQVYLWRPRTSPDLPADACSYMATLENDGVHGGPFRYRSILTDVLAWVIERAGGARLAELISRELWQPMGAEFDAEITVDAHGNPMADGGICATLGDLARFGQLFLNGACAAAGASSPRPGSATSSRAPPTAARPSPPRPRLEERRAGSHYRNQWWVGRPALPAYAGVGINGQMVFVHVPAKVVVAKFSTWAGAWEPRSDRRTTDASLAIADALSAV